MFSLGIPIVPAALTVRPALSMLQPGMLGSSALREFMWLFFSPLTFCDISYLPLLIPPQQPTQEQAIALAAQVTTLSSPPHHPGSLCACPPLQAQAAVANALRVPAVSYSKHDALAFRSTLLAQPALRTLAMKRQLNYPA